MTPDLESTYLERKIAARAAMIGATGAVVLALAPLVAILAYVAGRGSRALTLTFFTEPVGVHGAGMANAIVGTVELVILASAMGIPLGITAGLYLSEFRRTRLARAARFAADVLAGVPSILVGVVVYATVVVRMKHFSAFAGAASLAIVMLPLVARTTDTLARTVPDSLREAALALGVSRWRTAIFVVLRTAAPGIRSGCMLAVARVCGETAPLLFTAYNSRFYNESLFDPTSTLQVQIFTYTMTPNDDWHAQAWAAALALVAIVVLLSVLARRLLVEKEDMVIDSEPSVRLRGRLIEASGPAKMRAEKLSAWFGDKRALLDISLPLVERKVTAVIGPSGCGKSTFIRCLNRMHEVVPGARTAGEVLLDGKSVYGADVDPVRVRRRVGMVFQKPNPFPTMSVKDNVLAGLRLSGIDPPDAEAVVEEVLRQVALWEDVKDGLDRPGGALSGGQQQRLCIARCLALEPEVVLMDEPCSSLDPVATAKIEELIHDLRDRYTIVVVTHSMQQAARVSDYTAFFYLGELVEYDLADVIFTKPSDPRTEDYITGRFG